MLTKFIIQSELLVLVQTPTKVTCKNRLKSQRRILYCRSDSLPGKSYSNINII